MKDEHATPDLTLLAIAAYQAISKSVLQDSDNDGAIHKSPYDEQSEEHK